MRPDAPETPAHLQVHDGLAIAQNSATTLLPHANTTVSRGRKIADCHVIDQRRRSGLISVIVISCLKVGTQPSFLKQQQSCKPSALASRRSPSWCSSSSAFKIRCDSAIFRSSDLPPSRPRREPRTRTTRRELIPYTVAVLADGWRPAPNVAGHALVKVIRRSSTS